MQKWNRFDVQHAIKFHVEQELHQAASINWPRICSDEETLNDLLAKSIRLGTRLFANEKAN